LRISLARAHQPFASHRETDPFGDGDETLAVLLLDPRADRLDRVRAGVGEDLAEAGMLRQPLESAAGGEDQLRLSGKVAIEHFRRRDPGCAGAFAFDDARRPFALRRAGEKEERVEAALRVKAG
jgi:hypothetical protein